MIEIGMQTDSPEDAQERYRDNFARHLLGITLYVQSEIMHSLTQEHGHTGLRLPFEPYISIIGAGGARLSDIADLLGISRQAANQTANQIEAAGYVRREADPRDGRAKLLVTTKSGDALRREGARQAARLQREMEDVVGRDTVRSITGKLLKLNEALGLLLPVTDRTGVGAPLVGLLPRMRDYLNVRLMQLTSERGHPALKQSFGQVLTAIGPGGGRIQQMANAHGVSKQAIGAVANELEELGYIRREPDPADARQVLLRFTPQGQALIADSVASVDDTRAEFARILGEEDMQALCDGLRSLYRALQLEKDIFGDPASLDIGMLAGQLRRQLGEEGARALGQLLLSPGNT
jgi:DNA-binding MarR family transcriptional regulator